ncbi:MAG: hypothetical protein WC565_09560 [Parcubacteria group bacterium]|jgi:hypothetical protein
MTIDEVLDLTFAQFHAYLENIGPLIEREAAISMPWDAMVDKKHRPKTVPDFFKVSVLARDMTEEELLRFTKTGQV